MSRARHVSRRHRLRPALWAGTVLAALLQCQPAAAFSTGNEAMLEIGHLYQQTNGTGIYIEFKQASVMPGCYVGKGGYLKYSEPNFDRMWSTVLTLFARGPTRASILYDVVGGSETWSACDIRGIYIRP